MIRLFQRYYPIRNAIFAISEGGLIFLSVIISSRIILGNDFSPLGINLILKVFLITIICQLCLFYNDLYDLKSADTLIEISIRLIQSLGASAILLAAIYFILPGLIISEGLFFITTGIVIVFIVCWRLIYAQVLNLGLFNQKIMILGSSNVAKEICSQILIRKDCGYQISAVIYKDQYPDDSILKHVHFIKMEYNCGLCEIANQFEIKKIIVAIKEKRGTLPIKELLRCRVQGIDVVEGNTFYEMLTGKIIVESIDPSWLIFSQGFRKSKLKKITKRTIDLTISIIMSIILLPLAALIAIMIKFDSKGPVFFSQERIGQNRKPYKMHKFRSMRTNAETSTGPIWTQENDVRITRIGHFLRKWHIDEIPQLWNIVKGDMSFVGPRPERDHFIKQLENIIPYYNERFSVKPGLTGWAQVNYGYGASIGDAIEKLNYDLYYIKNLSTLLDIMVIARTVRLVFFANGR